MGNLYTTYFERNQNLLAEPKHSAHTIYSQLHPLKLHPIKPLYPTKHIRNFKKHSIRGSYSIGGLSKWEPVIWHPNCFIRWSCVNRWLSKKKPVIWPPYKLCHILKQCTLSMKHPPNERRSSFNERVANCVECKP